MADNVAITAGTGTSIATDDVGGAQYQRIKLSLGADGTAVDAIAGAGVVGTGVQRVTLASDDPAVASLAVLDDWDESDRAKVNPIAGQAGVAAGAGAVGATTQRTTLASDDPAVVALQIMDDWDESDRAKVNPIAGQAGVQGGSGTTNALTQRVVLATDVALPAGTNAIGKLAANSGVDIGDVDVTSIAAGDNNIGNVDIVTVPSDPFGVNADAASATGSISAKLRFIASTGIPVTGTVTVGSHAVTNAGTFAVQESGGALTALQLIDDAIVADDAAFTPATTKVQMAGFEFDDTTPDSVDEGDAGAARMSANRNIYTQLRDAAGNERGANVNASNQLAVAGPVTVASAGIASGAVASGAIASGAVASGAFASGSIGSGAVASGAIASGAVASGAFASGAIGSGAIASGAIASGAIASGAIAAGAIAAGATSIAENEDVASADGDRGVKVLFKRLDTPANASGTDGDYEQPQMSAGKLWVKHIGSFVTVTTQATRPADTTAYAANDTFSDSTSAPTNFTLTAAGRVSGGSGVITDAVFGYSTTQSFDGELWIFDAAVTSANDNAAFALSDGDRDKLVGIIPFTTAAAAANNASAHVTGLNIGFTCVGTANLRFLVKIITGYTPAASDVFTARLKILQID